MIYNNIIVLTNKIILTDVLNVLTQGSKNNFQEDRNGHAAKYKTTNIGKNKQYNYYVHTSRCKMDVCVYMCVCVCVCVYIYI